MEENKQEEVKPSVIEEVRKIRDDIFKARDELKAENDRKEKLIAESMLAGTAGGAMPKQEPKVETPKEYAERMLRGGK